MFAHSARGAVLEKKKKKGRKCRRAGRGRNPNGALERKNYFLFVPLPFLFSIPFSLFFISLVFSKHSVSLLTKILRWVMDPQLIKCQHSVNFNSFQFH